MKLKLSIAALLASVALVACGDSDSTTEPSASSTDAAVTTPDETVAQTSSSGFPASCVEYFETVEGFIAQYPDLGASYQAAIDQTKGQIESAEDSAKLAFESTCQTALDAFKSQTATMPQ